MGELERINEGDRAGKYSFTKNAPLTAFSISGGEIVTKNILFEPVVKDCNSVTNCNKLDNALVSKQLSDFFKNQKEYEITFHTTSTSGNIYQVICNGVLNKRDQYLFKDHNYVSFSCKDKAQ